MNKKVLIGIAVFLFVTVFALSLDVSNNGHRVKISSRDVSLNNESANVIGGNDVKLKLDGANISGAKIDAKSQGINLDSSTNVSSSGVNISSSSTEYNSDTSYQNQNTKFNSGKNITYKNLDTSEIDAALNEAKNISNQRVNPETQDTRRYMYKDIDWNTWKSNFVNQILDDSVNIRGLDNYHDGDWLSYSFYVDKRGRISKISVLSPTVSKEDRDSVAGLIKSYEGTDITVFPKNSKKSIVKVFAVMMLSTYTKKSNPKDFNDYERVKIEL